MLVVAVVRFRRRPGDDAAEPPQVYGSEQVEMAWTVIPVLIVIVLALTTARTVFEVQDRAKPAGALEVTVIGQQWWWEFRYPQLGIVTANELHVPVSDAAHPAPTFLKLQSADVAHSFWVPRLAGKTDLIPNRVNEMWMDPHEPGLYLGPVRGVLRHAARQDAAARLRAHARGLRPLGRGPAAPSAAAGDAVAGGTPRLRDARRASTATPSRGTVGNGRYGPDLTHLMSRETIAAGAVPNTPEQLRAWVQRPEPRSSPAR